MLPQISIAVMKDGKGYFGKSFRLAMTPSGSPRYLAQFSDKRRFETEDAAINAFNATLKEAGITVG